MNDHDDRPSPPEKIERQGVLTDLAAAAVTGVSAGVTGTVAGKLLDRPSGPPPEPQPEVILPPGVEKPE